MFWREPRLRLLDVIRPLSPKKHTYYDEVLVLNEVIMLREAQLDRILLRAMQNHAPIKLSSLSERQWQTAAATVTEVAPESFEVTLAADQQLSNRRICVGQTVGLSFSLGSVTGRYVCDTTVTATKSAPDLQAMVLAMPEEIERINEICYNRVSVPESTDVDVDIWQNSYLAAPGKADSHTQQGFQGRLLDVCAGGIRVEIDAMQGPELSQGQFVRLCFTPMENETPIRIDARVRNISASTDARTIRFGLETVGLEASPQGRMTLQRLCNVASRYDQVNKAEMSRNIESLFFG